MAHAVGPLAVCVESMLGELDGKHTVGVMPSHLCVGRSSGYNGAATMCVGTSCQAEYTNMVRAGPCSCCCARLARGPIMLTRSRFRPCSQGLTCFRPYASYGKGCSHWYMKCNPVWCNPVYCNPVRCWWDWGPRCSGGDCHGGDCHGGECWWEYTDGGGCAGGVSWLLGLLVCLGRVCDVGQAGIDPCEPFCEPYRSSSYPTL